MMYQHDTTVDHAPACLQLLDITTMQASYSLRAAFVTVPLMLHLQSKSTIFYATLYMSKW